jgi:hypothetical protein
MGKLCGPGYQTPRREELEEPAIKLEGSHCQNRAFIAFVIVIINKIIYDMKITIITTIVVYGNGTSIQYYLTR